MSVEECSPVQTYADAEALINDPRVLACRIADNGEPLVDVRTVQSLTCDTTRKNVQELSDNPFQLRTRLPAGVVALVLRRPLLGFPNFG
jgi:hypothetical protein